MMRVFVLCTGRTGSVTLARALSHATNFTVAHESRAGALSDRVHYPDDHIEIDNRLSFFLGALDERYGNDPLYVHLLRERPAVAASFAGRFESNIAHRRFPGLFKTAPRVLAARLSNYVHDPFSTDMHDVIKMFSYGMLMPTSRWKPHDYRALSELYVDTVNQNIRMFLKDKPLVARVSVESFDQDVRRLWSTMGAEGDLTAALADLTVKHNATRQLH